MIFKDCRHFNYITSEKLCEKLVANSTRIVDALREDHREVITTAN